MVVIIHVNIIVIVTVFECLIIIDFLTQNINKIVDFLMSDLRSSSKNLLSILTG